MRRYSYKLLNTWWIMCAVVVSLIVMTETGLKAQTTPDSTVYSGRVVNENGEPIAGAEVALVVRRRDAPTFDWYKPARESVTLTKTDGTFEIPRPLDRSKLDVWGVLASYPGCAYDGVGFTPEWEPLEMVITLRNLVAVTGTVRSMDGTPLPGASVAVRSIMPWYIEPIGSHLLDFVYDILTYPPPVECDENGHYRIESLPPEGRIYLSVEMPGYYGDWMPPQVYPDTDGNDIYLSQGGAIEGRVTAKEYGYSVPEPDAAVYATSQSVHGETVTDENGYYRIDGLRPGVFEVGEIQEGLNEWGYADKVFVANIESVTVIRGETIENVDFELLPESSR